MRRVRAAPLIPPSRSRNPIPRSPFATLGPYVGGVPLQHRLRAFCELRVEFSRREFMGEDVQASQTSHDQKFLAEDVILLTAVCAENLESGYVTVRTREFGGLPDVLFHSCPDESVQTDFGGPAFTIGLRRARP